MIMVIMVTLFSSKVNKNVSSAQLFHTRFFSDQIICYVKKVHRSYHHATAIFVVSVILALFLI